MINIKRTAISRYEENKKNSEEIEAVFAIPGGINYDAFQKVFDEMEDKL